MLGYAPEEVLGKTPFDLMPPDEAERVAEVFKAAVAARKPLISLENRNLRKDGHIVVLETNGVPSFDPSGRFLGYHGIDRDITARKRAEEDLRRSEANLNRAQAVAHIGSWYLDVPKNELLWSDETYRMFQIPVGTPLKYEPFLEKVHPDDREAVNAAWAAAIVRKPYDVEHRALVDGEVKWVRERAEVEFSPDGRALRGIGTVQDITELKKAQDALRRALALTAAAMESTADGILVVGGDGRFTLCNDKFVKMWGIPGKVMASRTTSGVGICP